MVDYLGISVWFFFSIHSEVSIGILQKMLLEVLEHPSISISMKVSVKKFGKLLIKTTTLDSFIQVHL